ncbi:MAG: DUF4350 domain-containing protein [Acidobacteria bacterium]|nr:DUF4350 domain-containing protein [Acidobacteriota bacterium]MCW5971287.1 DUF4350 domain-containing protein [Blastocatellales bacterium]
MRRYFSLILTLAIILGVLAALSALSFVEFDRPAESEALPRRSSYNAGPTGVRAFYQLLEESGSRAARWREDYAQLNERAAGASLVMVGPGLSDAAAGAEEKRALRRWVAGGGQLLVVSRNPREEFGNPLIRAISRARGEDWSLPPEDLVDMQSDALTLQPTELTRGISGLALSRLASRLRFEPLQAPAAGTAPTPAPEPTASAEQVEEESLGAMVAHMGDGDGAVLADFDYGDGRVIFLSDPFVIANNGIARGSNLALALNLVRVLAADGRIVYFDEAHHGYRESRNRLFAYFRGTPIWWVAGQCALIAALLGWSVSRRFARPMPLQPPDRHSPLEFVGSMANLQAVARARDLALENIYPRFRAQLARALGVSVRAGVEDFAVAIGRRRLPLDAVEVMRTMRECERALAGEEIGDDRLVDLVASMRRMAAAVHAGRRSSAR